MSAFIHNQVEAIRAGHEFNVTRVHADGSFSRAFVKPGAPAKLEEHGDALVVERTDGLHNVYVRGELQAVAESAEGALRYVKAIGRP